MKLKLNIPAVFFFALVIFIGCSKNKQTDNESKKNESHGNHTSNITTPQNASDNSSQTDGIRNLSYEPGRLPDGVKYDGKVVASAKWEDDNGQNYLLISETEIKNQDKDSRMKELFAYQYIVNGENAKQMWKIYDFIKECPVDVTLSYMPKSISVTDLDNNGIAETTFIYRMSCKGDVSEDDMKLIMHEGETKYAIRGTMKLILEGQTYGGTTNIDPSFNTAPKEFLDYAKGMWSKFQTEKFEH